MAGLKEKYTYCRYLCIKPMEENECWNLIRSYELYKKRSKWTSVDTKAKGN